MRNSQIGGANTNTDVEVANTVDDKPNYQENQILPLRQSSQTTEQLRVEQARMVDLLCILLIVSLTTASVVAFCVTRSLLSFSFLSLLSLLPAIRRRKEEAIFPINEKDFHIKLKELDVEIERIRKQSSSGNLPIFLLLKRILGK